MPADCPPAPARRVYLDATGVAPLHPLARQALLAALDDGWADPRRLHVEGRRARLLLESAREAVAAELGAGTEEVVFTASHQQAVHAAVQAVLRGRRRLGDRVLTSAVEHSAVLHATDHAGRAERVPVDADGRVDTDRFVAELDREPTALACLQSANGEVGTVQPVPAVADAARAAGVPLLVDAAAGAGLLPPPQGWDLLAADPRAWGGPPGAGILAVRAGTRWLPTWPEHDGTERTPDPAAVPEVLAAAAALRAVAATRREESARLAGLVDRIRSAAAALPDTVVHGDPVARLPHVVTFSCLYADGEALLAELDRAGFAVGSGSACTASTLQPSHVLAAMGVLTHGNVRVGLPHGTREADVAAFCAALTPAVGAVRAALGADRL